MTYTTTYNSDEYYLEVWGIVSNDLNNNDWLINIFQKSTKEWKIPRLLMDMKELKGDPLTPGQKKYLAAALCGYGSEFIFPRIQVEYSSARVDFSGLSSYVKSLLEKNNPPIIRKKIAPDKIHQYLEQMGYKRNISQGIEQFEKLSYKQKIILFIFTMNCKQLSVAEVNKLLNEVLHEDINSICQSKITEILKSLKESFLIEGQGLAAKFKLNYDSKVFVTERLVDICCKELITKTLSKFQWFNNLVFKNSQAERSILRKIINQLKLTFTNTEELIEHLKSLLRTLQHKDPRAYGYLASNLIQLFFEQKFDLTEYNFSGLTLWYLDLTHVKLHRSNFSNCELRKSEFAQVLFSIVSIAVCNHSQHLATLANVNGNCQVTLWEQGGNYIKDLPIPTGQPITQLAFHSHGKFLAAMRQDGIVTWSVATWNIVTITDGQIDFTDSSPDEVLTTNEGIIKIQHNGNWITLRRDRLYEGMNITGVTGLTDAEKAKLKAQGAVEY